MSWHLWLIVTVLDVSRLWNGQVGSTPDVRAQMDAILSRAVPDPRVGADARPAVMHALEVFAELDREARATVSAEGSRLSLEFDALDMVIDRNAPERQARLRELANRSLDVFVRRGVVSQLAEASDRPRVFMETWDSDRQEYLVKGFGNLRRVHRGLRFLTKRAAERGDWDQFVECVKGRLVLARFALGQPDVLGRLVGADVFGKIADDIQEIFVVFDPPSGIAARTFEAVRAAHWSDDLRLWFENYALAIRREIDATYTDDGSGNGYPVLSVVEDLPFFLELHSLRPSWASDVFTAISSVEEGPLNLIGLMMLDKRSALSSIELYLQRVKADSLLPRPERHPAPDWRDLTYWPPLAFHGRFMTVYGSALNHWTNVEDLLLLRRSGLLLLLSIHVYHDDHQRWPDSLNELPEAMRKLAERERVSGSAIMYKRIDPTADKHGRAFLIYAVGTNGVDDGGEEPENRSQAFDSIPRAKGDYVFNGAPAAR